MSAADGATVRVGESDWRWSVQTLELYPGPVVERTYVWLREIADTRNWMLVKVEGEIEPPTGEDVLELARTPAERRVFDHAGGEWVFEPVPGETTRILFRGSNQMFRVGVLPVEEPLGVIESSELLRMVETARP